MSKLAHWWGHIVTMEPARVRAGWTALAAVLVAAGVTVTSDTDARVTGAITALAVLLPIVQGELTRAVVVPVARFDAAIDGGNLAEDDSELDPEEVHHQ